MTTPTYPFSLDLNYIDLAAMDRQTLNSSAFKFWVNWKILHEGVIFSSDEAALSEYMLELAYGFPLSAFMREPNDLGMSSVYTKFFSIVQSQSVITSDFFHVY